MTYIHVCHNGGRRGGAGLLAVQLHVKCKMHLVPARITLTGRLQLQPPRGPASSRASRPGYVHNVVGMQTPLPNNQIWKGVGLTERSFVNSSSKYMTILDFSGGRYRFMPFGRYWSGASCIAVILFLTVDAAADDGRGKGVRGIACSRKEGGIRLRRGIFQGGGAVA